MQPDDADEHEDGAGHSVQNEFYGGVDAAFVSPDADQEIHGDQHYFPEEKEEKEVEREEHADDANFEHQQHDEEFFYAMLDAVPGRQNGNGGEKRCENDEEEADAVQAEVVVDRRNVDPPGEFLELITADADLNSWDEEQREKKLDCRDSQREAANPDVIVGAQEKKRKAGGGREEDHDCKQVAAVKH